jgi:hexokinase
MIVNMEWGAFGDDGCLEFLRTEFDHDLDRHSFHLGVHMYVDEVWWNRRESWNTH